MKVIKVNNTYYNLSQYQFYFFGTGILQLVTSEEATIHRNSKDNYDVYLGTDVQLTFLNPTKQTEFQYKFESFLMSDARMIDFSNDLKESSNEELNHHDNHQEIIEYDPMLVVAAQTVVSAQSASASFLQRKLNLGYNRCGRIMDELETIKIIGPFEGSAPRKVLFQDSNELNAHLQALRLL